jgi:hypothetical protein
MSRRSAGKPPAHDGHTDRCPFLSAKYIGEGSSRIKNFPGRLERSFFGPLKFVEVFNPGPDDLRLFSNRH